MKYIKPEFDVTIYEVEDILTESNGEPTTTPDLGYGEGSEGGDFDWGDF